MPVWQGHPARGVPPGMPRPDAESPLCRWCGSSTRPSVSRPAGRLHPAIPVSVSRYHLRPPGFLTFVLVPFLVPSLYPKGIV